MDVGNIFVNNRLDTFKQRGLKFSSSMIDVLWVSVGVVRTAPKRDKRILMFQTYFTGN
jgi:hypothetical protein